MKFHLASKRLNGVPWKGSNFLLLLLAYNEHLCYKAHMNATIRNLDEAAYRELKARAALEGKTMGEMIDEAIRSYLARPDLLPKRGSLRDLTPESYPAGNERLSEEINIIVYGG